MSFDSNAFDTAAFDGEGVGVPASYAPSRYPKYRYQSIWKMTEVEYDKNNVTVTVKKK